MAECRTRFAPSPTGFLHLGGARTALYCYLEARRRGGAFILRIEDTDRERSTSEAINGIIDGMQWLGLEYDEGPYYQTLRLDRYRDVAESMLRDGLAYRCDCSRERLDALREAAMASGDKPRYDGLCRDRGLSPIAPASVIRFRNPDHGEVVFDDRVRGHIEWRNQELDDLVIWRSDDYPTYNFAVVVDDIDMGITDVIRGDDHINNTPRQINIYRALKAPPPVFAHLPMIHGADGAKLSKRHGAVSVLQYRDDGYLPQALLNYLVRLGWSHGDQEIFSRAELVQLFDVSDVNRSAARFDLDKLDWINQQYLKDLPPDEVAPHLERHLRALGVDAEAGPPAVDIVMALRDRAKTLKDMAEKARIWFEPVAEYDAKAVAKHLKGSDAVLERAHAALASIDANAWSTESVAAVLQGIADELDLGMGKVAQPLRVAMTGTAVSPSIEHTVALMGQAGALARIDAARPLAI